MMWKLSLGQLGSAMWRFCSAVGRCGGMPSPGRPLVHFMCVPIGNDEPLVSPIIAGGSSPPHAVSLGRALVGLALLPCHGGRWYEHRWGCIHIDAA